jgi:cation transport ATPase
LSENQSNKIEIIRAKKCTKSGKKKQQKAQKKHKKKAQKSSKKHKKTAKKAEIISKKIQKYKKKTNLVSNWARKNARKASFEFAASQKSRFPKMLIAAIFLYINIDFLMGFPSFSIVFKRFFGVNLNESI